MSVKVRSIPMLGRILGLLLAVVFLGAQFHYCADLSTSPSGAHVCPLCSALGSAVTPGTLSVVMVPVANRLELVQTIAPVSLEIPHAVSPRAPPTV